MLQLPSLPFLNDPDVALGIAVKTLLDDMPLNEGSEERTARIKAFPVKFVPYATHFVEDLAISYAFFDALYAGIKTLSNEIPSADRAAWKAAYDYLQQRR